MTSWLSTKRVAGVLIATIVGAALPLSMPVAAQADPGLIPSTEAQILDLANVERLARGIRPLAHDPRLGQVAREWAYKLANEGTIYHMDVLPARKFGYKAGGENIVMGVPKITALFAHIEVMKSDLHRKNLLDPAFSHMAVGMSCASVNGFNYSVAVIQFGADSMPSADVPPAEPRMIQGDIKAGPGVTCQGYAPPAAPGPVSAPPPAPAPEPVPAPAPAPVVKKVVAPKPVVVAPAPAPVVVAPPVAPPVETRPVPSPEPPVVVEPEPVVVPTEVTTPAPDPSPVSAQAQVPVYEQTGLMLIAGFFGTMLLMSLVLAGVAGGKWHERRLAKARR